jgi:hypothetical protein
LTLFLLPYNTLQQLPMVMLWTILRCESEDFPNGAGPSLSHYGLVYICFPAAAEEEVTGRNRHVYSLLTFEFFSTTITMIHSNDGSPIRVLCGNIIHYLITTPSAVSFIDAGTGQLTRFRGESLTLLLLCSLATLYPAHPESATFIYRYS